MNKQLLKNLYDEIYKLKFPEFPEDDNLNEWITNLIEIDSHIIGMTSTILNNTNNIINSNSRELVTHLVDLRKQLNNINDISNRDKRIYCECNKYLLLLEEIVNCLNFK